MGVKLTSLTSNLHISYFITMLTLNISEEPVCQEYTTSFNLMWWVHIVCSPYFALNLLLRTKLPELSIFVDFAMTILYQTAILYTASVYFQECDHDIADHYIPVVAKWLWIEILTFFSHVLAAIFFLFFYYYACKKCRKRKNKEPTNKDIIEFYYDWVQIMAIFLSMVTNGIFLNYIDFTSEGCTSILPYLIWLIVAGYIILAITTAVFPRCFIFLTSSFFALFIAVVVLYFTSNICQEEEAAKAYVLSSMISFVIGIVTGISFFYNQSRNRKLAYEDKKIRRTDYLEELSIIQSEEERDYY